MTRWQTIRAGQKWKQIWEGVLDLLLWTFWIILYNMRKVVKRVFACFLSLKRFCVAPSGKQRLSGQQISLASRLAWSVQGRPRKHK